MTTVTITIDDPNGLDSNLLFPSAFPYQAVSAGTVATTAGNLGFRRVVNGVVVDQRYQTTITGSDIDFTGSSVDVHGDVASMALNLVGSDGVLGTQLIHADFALDGDWLTFFGGVHVESLASLTADVLMGRIMQRTSANLVVIGNVGNDILNGSFLNDTLRGGAGADRLRGGEGNDTASYEGSNLGVTVNLLTNTATGGHAAGDTFSSIENIIGTNLGDTMTGDAAANFIDGAFGFDTIDGGGGDDFIFGRDGGGLLRGGAGNDRVDGGAENDIIFGGTGNDELRVGDGTNEAYGQDGNDVLLGASGNDRLSGGAGADNINGVTGNDILDGGSGADFMTGTTGASRYYVDNVGDQVFDFGSNDGDRAFTSISYTLAFGSEIERFSTTNTAGTGAINLTGNEFDQSIYGNAGANVIDGKAGRDTMTGYGGNDTYFVDSAHDDVVEAANRGSDKVLTAVSYTLTSGSEIELFTTTDSAATTAINLNGNALAQTIHGNNGANVINGREGSDTLRGFGGADTFYFNSALGPTNVDRIVDFNVAADTIQLRNAVFTGLAAGTLSAGAFFIGVAAHDSSDRIIYNSATGALSFDANGNGAGGSVVFATLSTGLAMTNTDFFVI